MKDLKKDNWNETGNLIEQYGISITWTSDDYCRVSIPHNSTIVSKNIHYAVKRCVENYKQNNVANDY